MQGNMKNIYIYIYILPSLKSVFSHMEMSENVIYLMVFFGTAVVF